YGVQGLAMALLFGDGKVIFRPRMRIYPCRQGQTENSMRSPAGRAQAGRRTPQGEQARSARPKSGQAVERGIEQGAKACALIEVRENSGGLLLESSMADFVSSTFEERPHAVLGRLHMKLQSKNAPTYCKGLGLCDLAAGEQRCPARQIVCLAMPMKW